MVDTIWKDRDDGDSESNTGGEIEMAIKAVTRG